jgi:hypothetical protein
MSYVFKVENLPEQLIGTGVIEIKPINKAARLLIGRHDKYPTSAPAGQWSMNYQDAKFVPGDVIQLSLTEDTHLP